MLQVFFMQLLHARRQAVFQLEVRQQFPQQKLITFFLEPNVTAV